jgi:hypothetical protein
VADEENADREANIAELHRSCGPVGKIVDCPTEHADPLLGIDRILASVASAKPGAVVTVDISTFPRNSLLLVLRALHGVNPALQLRLVYTEPGTYNVPSAPTSSGLCTIEVVPTYSAPYKADEELVLVIFLGFERDRVLGLWQSIAPHKTIVVIGDPPYRTEWTGVSEHINAALLAGLSDDSVYRVDPRNPSATFRLLEKLIGEREHRDNYYIAPFGTKPQTVGVFSFCERYPKLANVVYAAPVAKSEDYLAAGIGPTWFLPVDLRAETV